MSSSLNRCRTYPGLPTCWGRRYASAIKLLLLSLLLLPSAIVKSQTVHWSQSSNKNNTQGTVVWIGSIVQSSNSTFYEGQSTLQRLFLLDIPTDPTGKYKFTFKHLATKGSINAYDFVTGWYNTNGSLNGKAISTSNDIDPNCYLVINNCSETGQNNDPVFMICGTLDAAPLVYSNAVPSSSYAVPSPGTPNVSSNSNVKARVDDWDNNFSPTGSDGRRITIQSNATVSAANLVMTGYGDENGDVYAHYELSWTGPTAPGSYSILVKIGGHIADQLFYGTGKGASNINGGPYHFKVSNLYLGNAPFDSQHTISLGDRDNQLKGADILIPPPPCDITPQSQSICAGGTSQQFCGPADMANYAWSILPAGASLSATNTQCVTVTSNTPGTYTLTLVTTKSGVQSTQTCNATLIVNPNPTAAAGPDQTLCQTKPNGPTVFNISGTAQNGTGAWSKVSSTGGADVSFGNASNAATTASVSGIGTVTIRFTVTSNTTPGCGTAQDDLVLTVNANPTAAAGDDQTLCQTKPNGPTVFNISGTAQNGTGAWSKVSSTGGADVSFGNANNAATTASVSGIGTVTIRFTVTSNATPSCGDATDDLVLTVNANPTAAAGDDQTLCQTKPNGPTVFNISGTAQNGTGAWSKVSSTGGADVSFGNANNAATTASVSGIGTVTIRFTVTSNATPSCGDATDDLVLTVNANPTAAAGDDQTLCQTKPNGPTVFNISGTAQNGTGAWSKVSSTGGADVSFGNANNAATTASVSGIGTVTIRFTVTSNATPSCGDATDDLVLTVNANPTANAGDDQAVCQTKPSGPTVFNISGSGTNGTGAWSKVSATGTADVSFGDANSAATTASVSGVGTVTIRYTITNENCGTASDDAVLTVNANPIASCSSTPSLIDINSAAHNTQLDVDLSANADTDPTHYTYVWTEDGVGSLSANNVKNPVYTAAVLDGGQVISFTVTITHIATGCTTVSNCSVTVNTAGSCPQVTTSAICNGSTSSFSADRAPAPTETWTWSANNGAVINSPNGQQSVSVTAGNQSFTLKLTITFANTELSPIECNYEVPVSSCAGSCTYTQGKYGNTSTACDADGTDGTPVTYPSVLDMIKALLGVNGVADPLYIGGDGIAKPRVTIPATASAATLLHASMPGSSTPRELFGNCTVDNVPVLPACWTPGTSVTTTYINKQGKINNVLLSQTIALGLNMRLSGSLGGFVLQAGTFATAARDGGCGSTVPKVRVCYYDLVLLQWVVQNEYTFKTITQSVIDALSCKQYPLTVAGLYQLANDALGNIDGTVGYECGASLADINKAVSAINEGFDECRIFISWTEVPCGTTPASRIDITASGTISGSGLAVNELKIAAYPNPFRDKVNFAITAPVSGKASLEVYNLFGQKLQTVYEGYLVAGRNQIVEFTPGTVASGVLIYKLSMGDKVITGRVINIKQ
ncbi:T9SS type A sorting domain-containing protein [Lacibacter luteus]|nr:T9SS type A sorting domain-containing protein [Lacibacter luteus]